MRKALLTIVLSYLGMTALTGCGLLDTWREEHQTPQRAVKWEKPNRAPAMPVSKSSGGGGVVPHLLPDRLPSAPKFLPMTCTRVPTESNEVIDVVPTAIETPVVQPFKNVVPPPIKVDLPKPIEQVKAKPEVNKVVQANAAVKKTPHAEGYRTLVGQVQEFRKTWRLRYSSVEQGDPHGGSVVLEGDGDFSALRDGMTIRVQGVLIPAADRTAGARYRVQNFEVVE